MAQIVNKDIVINYRNSDKDECIHFLTHIDAENGPAPDASYYISVTAKTIYTSRYNVWFLNTHYNCKNVLPWGINTKVTLQFKGTKYIFTLLDAKHCLGSVSILLYGACGAHLYTGNFSYYSSFFRSPLMFPLVERKIPLKCLYMDGTYYEQDTNFLGIDENIELATALIRYTNVRILLFIDSIHLYPILAELAIRLQEKLYISTSESMKFLKICGYDNLFTTQEKGSRITVFEELKTNNSKGLVLFFHRIVHKESNEFKKYKVDQQTSAHHFYFYGSSNHADCCTLLNKFVPEELIHLNRAVIDSSKIEYHLVNIDQSAVSSTSYSSSKTVLFKSIPINKYDTFSINSNEWVADKISKGIFCEQNEISPSLTANKGLSTEPSNNAVRHPKKFLANHLLDSVSHESNDHSKIIVCSDDEPEKVVKTTEKSLKGTIRVRKFDDSFFYKPVSSNNSSKAILNLNKPNEMSLVSNNNSTFNVPQKAKNSLSHQKFITTQIEEYKEMVGQYKTNKPILPKNRNRSEKVICSDNTETSIQDKTLEDPLCIRKFDDKVKNSNEIIGTKLIANKKHEVSTFLNDSFTSSSSIQAMNKNNGKDQIDDTLKRNESVIQKKPLIVKHIINVKKVYKVPPQVSRNSKMVCRTIARKSLGERNAIPSLTDSSVIISKEIEANSVLLQLKSNGSQTQETANESKSCVSTSEQNEMDKCSNKTDIYSKPSISKGVVCKKKIDLLMNSAKSCSEIFKGSIPDENRELPSFTPNTCLESGTNFIIVPKQLLCSQNLTESSYSTIDNVDTFNSDVNICRIDSTKQDDDVTSSVISPSSENRKIVNSSKVVGQSKSTKTINQSNDFETCDSEKLAVEDNLENESLSERVSLVEGNKSKRIKLDDVNTEDGGETVALKTRSNYLLNENPKPIDFETQIRNNIRPCSVVIDTNSITRRHFYSPFNNCYLPSFFGFHRSSIRPRKQLNALRMLKKKLGKHKMNR